MVVRIAENTSIFFIIKKVSEYLNKYYFIILLLEVAWFVLVALVILLVLPVFVKLLKLFLFYVNSCFTQKLAKRNANFRDQACFYNVFFFKNKIFFKYLFACHAIASCYNWMKSCVYNL